MNLTQASKMFRKALLIFGASAVVYYLATLILFPAVQYLLTISFPENNDPNPAYGKLPPLTLIEKPISEERPKFTLNTTTGNLPGGFPDRMTVYRFKDRQVSFLQGTDAVKHAAFLGFTDEDLTSDLKGNVFTWKKRSTGSELRIELQTSDLNMQTNFAKYPTSYPKGKLTESTAEKVAKDLFRKINRFDDTLYTTGYSEVYFGTIGENQDVNIPNSSREYQVARVDLYRDINEYPILGQDPKKGLLHAIVKEPSKEADTLNYPVIEAYYKELETESPATYPILTVREAWNAVSQDKGVITSVLPRNYNPFNPYERQRVDNILIDNIYLAYYETNELQPYLQPIYVFEGKYTTRGTEGGEITLYYPAIRGDYIQ